MALSDLTREGVLSAIRQHDEIGGEAFLQQYGFGAPREYWLSLNGRQYPSKAIVGAAHGFARRDLGPLRPEDFSGGEATVKRLLERLGFIVLRGSVRPLPVLNVGEIYTWEQLAEAFNFDAKRFQVAGGMLSCPEFNALLLITHPGGARSFDYEDRWDGVTLIYTGRGKTGDQRLEGPNQDVAENRRALVVLEAAGTRQLLHLGMATCTQNWTARAMDSTGAERNVFKFRLAFDQASQPHVAASSVPASSSRSSIPVRTSRPFDATAPAPRAETQARRSTPEETAALQEKANQEHHRVLARLADMLTRSGWTSIEEIPSAIDLKATHPCDGRRVIFEVKTLSGSNEVSQCRAALSQLLEYRFFYGQGADCLCLVVNAAIADRRRAFLEEHNIAVVRLDETRVQPVGRLAETLLATAAIQTT